MKSLPETAADRRQPEPASDVGDRLLTFREVNALLGLHCRTAHTVRGYAARGLIRAVRLNGRMVRYSQASVLALIAGQGAKAK